MSHMLLINAVVLRPLTVNCEPVSLQSIGQPGWIAHRDHVTTVDFIHIDGEPLAGDPSLKEPPGIRA